MQYKSKKKEPMPPISWRIITQIFTFHYVNLVVRTPNKSIDIQSLSQATDAKHLVKLSIFL